MSSPLAQVAGSIGYADCLEAVRARLAARGSRLFGMAVLVVYVHEVERLYASVGHGHAARMLDELRNRLSQVARQGDYFARLGDRKFVFVVSNLRNEGHALLAANKILRTGAEPLIAGGEQRVVKLSVGISMHPAHGHTPEGLMQCAEIALLEAWKAEQPAVVYTARSAEALVAGWDLETQLGHALDNGDLVLAYQPKLSLPDLRVTGAEALMRWNRPEAGDVPPDVFIDLAEMTGQIDPLTRFAVHRALRQLSEWPKSLGHLGVAVNVTPSIICNPELVDLIRSAAGLWSADPSRLTIEVTENALMHDRERSHAVLTAMRELGVRVSIDDFGTGYSSLTYLKQIPADELKIDRSFVMNMQADKSDRRICELVVALGHSFGMQVVAEGVEDEAVAQELTTMGCDHVQGFLFSRPLPPDDFVAWLQDWRSGPRMA